LLKRVKKRRRRWLAGLAGLTAGVVGAGVLLRRGMGAAREKRSIYPEYNRGEADRWARPGMSVTLRAELMPGRSRAERTYRVEDVLPSGRVRLAGLAGDHTESEFEPVR
jgi:hypothetical protein